MDELAPYALVADNNVLVRIDATDVLTACGFRVYSACGVHDAIEILRTSAESIQLLLADVQMSPGEMDGFYLARECAKNWPHIGIVICSGMVEPGIADMPGGARFVKKPFSDSVVYEHLTQILPGGQKPQQLTQRCA